MTAKLKTSEHDHQVTVMDWAELMAQRKYPMLRWLYAVPNGGDRHPAVAAKLKAEGVKSGVPDLCLPYPLQNNHEPFGRSGVRFNVGFKCCGLYIEMKTKGGTVKPHQKEWLDYLAGVGYRAVVCWSADEAIQTLEEYLKE